MYIIYFSSFFSFRLNSLFTKMCIMLDEIPQQTPRNLPNFWYTKMFFYIFHFAIQKIDAVQNEQWKKIHGFLYSKNRNITNYVRTVEHFIKHKHFFLKSELVRWSLCHYFLEKKHHFRRTVSVCSKSELDPFRKVEQQQFRYKWFKLKSWILNKFDPYFFHQKSNQQQY